MSKGGFKLHGTCLLAVWALFVLRSNWSSKRAHACISIRHTHKDIYIYINTIQGGVPMFHDLRVGAREERSAATSQRILVMAPDSQTSGATG